MRIASLLQHLRIRPFPLDTADGRSAERYRRAILSMLTNVLSRALSMLVMVLTVRWTVPYLGTERFGAWMAVASFATLLGFLDLGIGNSLTNRIAHASSTGDSRTIEKIVSGGLGLLLIVAFLLAPILATAALLLPWSSLIKTQSIPLSKEIAITFGVFGVLFAISMLTNGVARIFHGLQQGYEVHMAAMAGSLIGLTALVFAVRAQAGLPALLLCSMGGSILGNLALWIVLWLRGQFKTANWTSAIREETLPLLKVGGLFFVLQIGTMVGWGADSLLISSNLGAASVAIFSVTQRLYQFASQPLAVMNSPLWPAFANAHSHGDKHFISKTLKKSLVVSLVLGSTISLILLAVAHPLIHAWTKGLVHVPSRFLTYYAVWAICDVVGTAFAMFMNGCNIVRPQVVAALTLVVVSLPLKYLLITNYGMEAMLLGSIILFIVNVLFWYGFVYRREIRQVLR